MRSARSRCDSDVAGQLGARILQVLDIDREAGDRAGRQRHVDQSSASAARRRSWRAGCGRRRGRSGARPGRPCCAPTSPALSINSAPRAITSAALRPSTAATNAELTSPRLRSGPRYHIGKGALSISWVSASSAFSVWRRRRVEVAALGVGAAGVDQPQQDGARRRRRRRQATANVEHPPRPGAADLPVDARPVERGAHHLQRQRVEVAAIESLVLAAEIVEPGRRLVEAEIAQQRRVGLDLAIGADQQRARGRGGEQGGKAARGRHQRIGAAHPPRGDQRQRRGDRDPHRAERHRERDEADRGHAAQSDPVTRPPLRIDGS